MPPKKELDGGGGGLIALHEIYLCAEFGCFWLFHWPLSKRTPFCVLCWVSGFPTVEFSIVIL